MELFEGPISNPGTSARTVWEGKRCEAMMRFPSRLETTEDPKVATQPDPQSLSESLHDPGLPARLRVTGLPSCVYRYRIRDHFPFCIPL